MIARSGKESEAAPLERVRNIELLYICGFPYRGQVHLKRGPMLLRILIADDHAPLLEMLKALIETHAN